MSPEILRSNHYFYFNCIKVSFFSFIPNINNEWSEMKRQYHADIITFINCFMSFYKINMAQRDYNSNKTPK